MSKTKQTTFQSKLEKSRQILERATNQYDVDHITVAVSGGTDSIVAAHVTSKLLPEFGVEVDSVTHIRTGTGIPQSRLVAKTLAEMIGVEYNEQGYRNQRNSLAWRVLSQGWPAGYGGHPSELGHGREWANRKDKPMQAVYMMHQGMQMWISGARKLESKKRSGSVPDNGVQKDKPRRVWVSPISGWTSAEKQDYIKEYGLPVSEAYQLLGFSGECTACAYDETGLLTNIDLLAPELGYALRSLAVWLYQRVKRGDVELDAKQLCWGWQPNDKKETAVEYDTFDSPEAQELIGCDEDSCQTREMPDWIMDLPPKQIIDRDDVVEYWQTQEVPARFC